MKAVPALVDVGKKNKKTYLPLGSLPNRGFACSIMVGSTPSMPPCPQVRPRPVARHGLSLRHRSQLATPSQSARRLLLVLGICELTEIMSGHTGLRPLVADRGPHGHPYVCQGTFGF